MYNRLKKDREDHNMKQSQLYNLMRDWTKRYTEQENKICTKKMKARNRNCSKYRK